MSASTLPASETSAQVEPSSATDSTPPKISIQNADFFYTEFKALKGISLDIAKKEVTAFIGPSGCGKSTLLRCLNRMNDLIPGARLDGKIYLDGEDLYDPGVDVVEVRRRLGMVFQKPNPFPKSIRDNLTYAPKLHGSITTKDEEEQLVEKCLQKAGLWNEVKDRLDSPGTALSGGQQQRLCIARTIAVEPRVVLMDEPCSALDPIATGTIEELITELKAQYTVVIVTHNMQQATRISDRTAFFYLGELIEFDETQKLFTTPANKKTEDYISGRFG